MNNKNNLLAEYTMLNRLKLAVVLFFMTFASAAVLAGDIGIGVFPSNTGFVEGARVDFYISGYNNSAASEKVDVHIAVLTKEGVFYEYPDWNTAFKPWLSSFSLPANFTLPATLIGSFDNFPGGLETGVYKVFVALTKPGTLDILALESSSFAVLESNDNWLAAAVSLTSLETVNGPTPFASVSAAGIFERVNFNVSDILEWQKQFEPQIERCVFKQVTRTLEVFVGDENVTYIDAGSTLELTSPAGKLDLERQTRKGKIFYVNTGINESYYQAGASYTASGFGSMGIPAFSGTVVAPKEIVVTKPDLDSFEQIDSSKDFVVRWQGLQSIGEVGVQLQGDAVNSILCRFSDDGEGIIPSALIVQLRDAISGLIPSDFTNVSLVISRTHLELIDLKGETVTFSISSAKAAVGRLD